MHCPLQRQQLMASTSRSVDTRPVPVRPGARRAPSMRPAAVPGSSGSAPDAPVSLAPAAQQPVVPAINYEDPQARFQRYGKNFGGHKLSMDWLESVPRVRVRSTGTRQLDELVELAVLNERLAGHLEPWQARRKLEYLRKERRNWERIFEYVTKQDAAATLTVIEEASRKVCRRGGCR